MGKLRVKRETIGLSIFFIFDNFLNFALAALICMPDAFKTKIGKKYVKKIAPKIRAKYSQNILKIFKQIKTCLVTILMFLLQIFANSGDMFNFSCIFGLFY